MTATTKSTIAIAVLGSTIVGIIAWRVVDRHPPMITNVALLCDPSDSMTDGQAPCLGLADRALAQPNLAKGSTVTIMRLGDEHTSNEPAAVVSYEVPYSRRALEGRGVIARRKVQVLADLHDRLKKLPRTRRSPIFLAVKRGVEHLRGSRCGADSDCHLFVRTDGEETEELAIKKALESKGKPKELPNPIVNEGITVTFCGLAETQESANSETKRHPVHDARHGDRIREVWSSLFTAPNLVSFDPYCPTSQTGATEK